jgi:hypothetical protein
VDPNQTLFELRREMAALRRHAQEGDTIDPFDVEAAVTLFEALDGWLSRGGFLPDAWATRRAT